MATFLELVKAVARESGTVSDLSAPATVTGQTGRLLRIVNWTRDAYTDIQRLRSDWRWLRAPFKGDTLANVRHYKIHADSRFKHWIFEGETGLSTFTSQLASADRAAEARLKFRFWGDFEHVYLFGSAAEDTGPPAIITADPQDQLVLYPIPDGAYTLRGEYYKSPQILTNDADVPEMPAAHHDAIRWRALILMATFDEAVDQLPIWAQFLRDHYTGLIHSQTPRVQLAEPLA